MIRSGRYGERDQWALGDGYSGGTFPGEAAGRLNAWASQFWSLRGRIESGDLMALPLKTTKQIALGRVTGGYTYSRAAARRSCSRCAEAPATVGVASPACASSAAAQRRQRTARSVRSYSPTDRPQPVPRKPGTSRRTAVASA